MRIGLFTDTYPPFINGVSTSVLMLKKGLERLGHEVFVVTVNSDSFSYKKELNVLRLPGIPIGIFDYRLTSLYPLRAKKIIKSWNLDIIHTHTEFGVGSFARLLSKEYNIELDIRIREEKLHENIGHIPTIDELSNLNAVDSIYIKIKNDNYNNDINERIDYIKQISKDLIDQFKISREINIIFRKYGFSDSYSYEVKTSKNIIKIIDEHNKTSIYEYNINDIENKN